jgi:putative iron-dependent peroxidase
MATPQTGIYKQPSRHHHFLEYAIDKDTKPESVVRALRAGEASPGGGVDVVVAFGAALWNQIAPEPTPDGLRAFETIQGAQGSAAPATQRDLLFWIHGGGIDDNLDRAFGIDRKLGNIARLELDQQGFVTRDSRDLTGFIDGTANPKAEAARETALIPPHRPGAGGAFVLSQRWVHDLQSFLALPVPEQERVIGRTKPDSIEFEADAMPADAHVARTDVSVDGVAQKILRRSVPFGSVVEHGLYFLAFSCDPARFDIQLRRMFGVSGDGVHDRLTEYSRPVTGSYWFAPSQQAMRGLMEAG